MARTGWQEYLPEELGLPPPDSSRPGLIRVFRPPEEVFAPETVASFQGMPVTNNHHPDGVDIENIRRFQMGHAHNIRRGAGAESDLLLADLIITDPCLIDAILAGKREISCGYTYELAEENGRYVQRKIRGNHIAVVDAGRAGPRVSIRDAKTKSGDARTNTEKPRMKPGPSFPVPPFHPNKERSLKSMKHPLSKVLARMAKDGDVEAVAEIIEEMITETPPEAEAPVTVEVPENHEITVDEESVAALMQRLDQLITLLTAALNPEAPAADDEPDEIGELVEEVLEASQAEAETPVPAEEIAELVEEILDPEPSVTLEEEDGECEEEQDPAVAKDALRAALLTFRPVLRKMSDRERSKTVRDIAANIRRMRKAGDSRLYTGLAGAHRPSPSLQDLGKRIMAARNANYKR